MSRKYEKEILGSIDHKKTHVFSEFILKVGGFLFEDIKPYKLSGRNVITNIIEKNVDEIESKKSRSVSQEIRTAPLIEQISGNHGRCGAPAMKFYRVKSNWKKLG